MANSGGSRVRLRRTLLAPGYCSEWPPGGIQSLSFAVEDAVAGDEDRARGGTLTGSNALRGGRVPGGRRVFGYAERCLPPATVVSALRAASSRCPLLWKTPWPVTKIVPEVGP